MPDSDVLVDVTGGVATVTLNRPDRLNTIAIETVGRLVDALAEAAASPARVVVLAGAGKAFCAGADQGEMVPRDAAEWERIVRHYLDPVRAIVTMDKPVVAALHGDTVGGGLGLAMACDIRLVADGARLGAPFTRIGLAGCDMSTGWFLPRLVGLGTATELMLTGRLMPASEALSIGLVHEVVAPADFAEALARWTARFAAGPPGAYRWTKRAIHRSLATEMEGEFEFEILAQVQCLQTADHAEGVAAFRARRPPEFTGA